MHALRRERFDRPGPPSSSSTNCPLLAPFSGLRSLVFALAPTARDSRLPVDETVRAEYVLAECQARGFAG